MNRKEKVFSRFQEFKAQEESLTRKNTKGLRKDNGGEYTSNDFCKEVGIKRELTVPYNPQ